MAQIKKRSGGSKNKDLLAGELQREIGKSKEIISRLQVFKNDMQDKDRLLKKKQAQKSDNQILEFRKMLKQNIYDTEKQIILEEHKYSNLVMQKIFSGESVSALSVSELKDLKQLAKNYQAFSRFLKTGLKRDIDKLGETCPWSTCWGCTAACGGCTSCGAACSPGCAGGSRPE